MRMIDLSKAIRKDFKRIKANPRHTDLDQVLGDVTDLLIEDMPLPQHYRDHALVGNWKNYRECHIKPDLLLVYKFIDMDILHLARLGSHSELFK